VDIALDLHGAETMFPVTNCIVAPEQSMRIATMVSMTITAMEGFENHVEPSPKGFRGLSHREIGDYSRTAPFLMEAPFPFLDQPTGPKTRDLLMTGRDPFLLSLAGQQKLFVPYDASGWPIERRVGQHCSVALEIIRQYSKKNVDRAIRISEVPRYADLLPGSWDDQAAVRLAFRRGVTGSGDPDRGLGLAAVADMVRAWGGTLRLRSGTAACEVGAHPGERGGLAPFPGTQVNITLPHADRQ